MIHERRSVRTINGSSLHMAIKIAWSQLKIEGSIVNRGQGVVGGQAVFADFAILFMELYSATHKYKYLTAKLFLAMVKGDGGVA